MTRSDIDGRAAAPAKRQRIAKLMARAGLCSRRDAEAWVLAGRVSVNSEVLTSPARDVGDDEIVLVDGVPLPVPDKTRLFLFHKPRGLVTSDRDPEGRATVFDYLKENWPEGPRVVTVGRLDINTEGLLLLTNDGGLARVLELPQTGWVRRYRVRAKGAAVPAALDALADGIEIDGIRYAGIEAKLDRVQGSNCWLTMGLREGKNREVKRVLEHLGLEVNRLIRISFGPFQLLDLPDGAVEEVRTRILRDQLGPSLAAQADVSFDVLEPDVSGVAKAAPSSPAGRQQQERRARRPSGDRPRQERDAPATRRERPVAGTRKHISTLRAVERSAAHGGPRKRLERSSTQDRRARQIAVERLVAAKPSADVSGLRRRDGRVDGEERVRAAQPHGAKRHQKKSRDDRDARGRNRHSDGGRRHESPSAEAKRQRRTRSGGGQRPQPDAKSATLVDNRGRPPAPDKKGRGGRRREPTGAGAVRSPHGKPPGPVRPKR